MLEVFLRRVLIFACIFYSAILFHGRLKIMSRKCFLAILFNYFFINFLGGDRYFNSEIGKGRLDNFHSCVKTGQFHTLCGLSHGSSGHICHVEM